MTIETLEEELKSGELDSLYLLYGEEVFLLENVVKRIKKLFGELVQGINYIQIDDTNINSFSSDLKTPAFGYEKKLIIIKNAGLFKKVTGKTASAAGNAKEKFFNCLEENIALMKESAVVVIIETNDTVAKNSKILKFVDANGTVCNFEKLKLPALMGRLKAIINAYGVKVQDSVLKYLIETSGVSMQVLINEVRKLIEYAGKDGEIKKQDVDKLTTRALESVIFDLTDNLGKKETKKAINVLNEMLYNKEPIQKIMITLYNHFKKLYIVKLAEAHNRNLTESLKLKPNQMFLVTKYKQQAAYFNLGELRQILEELIKLDESYKIRINRCKHRHGSNFM